MPIKVNRAHTYNFVYVHGWACIILCLIYTYVHMMCIYKNIHTNVCLYVYSVDDYTYLFYDQFTYFYVHNILYMCGLFGGDFNWQFSKFLLACQI